MAGRIILFEEAAILNLRTTAVFEFQMVTKSLTLISEKLCQLSKGWKLIYKKNMLLNFPRKNPKVAEFNFPWITTVSLTL